MLSYDGIQALSYNDRFLWLRNKPFFINRYFYLSLFFFIYAKFYLLRHDFYNVSHICI
jgi:hypothetical protein